MWRRGFGQARNEGRRLRLRRAPLYTRSTATSWCQRRNSRSACCSTFSGRSGVTTRSSVAMSTVVPAVSLSREDEAAGAIVNARDRKRGGDVAARHLHVVDPGDRESELAGHLLELARSRRPGRSRRRASPGPARDACGNKRRGPASRRGTARTRSPSNARPSPRRGCRTARRRWSSPTRTERPQSASN